MNLSGFAAHGGDACLHRGAARAGGCTSAMRMRLRSPGWACLLAVLCSLGSLISPARAQSPEDRYVKAYTLLEQADKLNADKQAPEAVTRYLEAQVALNNLQQTYPEWNPKLVAFRLQYISGRLEPLTQKATAPARGAASAAPSVADQAILGRHPVQPAR